MIADVSPGLKVAAAQTTTSVYTRKLVSTLHHIVSTRVTPKCANATDRKAKSLL